MSAPPFDLAVVLTGASGALLADSLRSVYDQGVPGRLQVLLGLDGTPVDHAALDALVGRAPSHVVVAVIDGPRRGTPLRAMLAYLAHAPLVAFLEGGNRWRADHLAGLHAAVAGRPWAFSLRSFVHASSGDLLTDDDWASVGPEGGFVAPDCVMLSVDACEPVFRHWAEADGDHAASRALAAISGWGATGRATALVRLDPAAADHRHHLAEIVRRRVRDFAGYRQYAAGDHAAAAASFEALFALDRPSADGLVWWYLARARGGDPEAARAGLQARLDPADPAHGRVRDLVLGAGLPPEVRQALRPRTPATAPSARLAFYAGQLALLAGEERAARVLLGHAATGPDEAREAVAARAELARLRPRRSS